MAAKGASKVNELLRRLPSVDQLLNAEPAGRLVRAYGRELVAETIREAIETARSRIREGGPVADETLAPAAILRQVEAAIRSRLSPRLGRAINATGVILHTGLGRAILPRAALDAIASELRGYALLEVDRETGDRSHREVHVVDLLKPITGAEAATVVNNNAGATLIALSALARGREVIVSRGQLVEIGGSFRIPEVMAQSGARLVEVGTTNKTYLRDYERALGPDTALLLRVHTSNFRIVGFTTSPTLEELVELGRRHGLPVMDDLGSGALVDLSPYGVRGEPLVAESIRAGADVVTFSGDKLLGGPQAGIILGKAKFVSAIRQHPLFRALRVDKLALVALEATLKLYLDPDRLAKDLPALAMVALSPEELERRALDLASKLKAIQGLSVEILDDNSEVGGGSVPAQMLPTKVVAIRHPKWSLEELARVLRLGSPSVFVRVQRERILFDVRTLLEGEAAEIASALSTILGA